MTNNIQLLIPMSGQGTRYAKAGYKMPKPLIPVNGTPMIERLLQKIPIDWPCTFVLAENHKTTDLEATLKKLRPQSLIMYVPANSEGPSLAIQSALPKLDQKMPVLVSYCDYGVKWDPWDFAEFVKNSNCDACVVSYRGFHAHYIGPMKYAYSRLEGERVVQVKEKGSFTELRENEYASNGAYYFKSVDDLKAALEFQKKNDIKMNGEFYTSLTVEALLQLKPTAQCRVYEVDAFYQWGTPEDLKIFEYWEMTFKNLNKFGEAIKNCQTRQLLMPMAGLGSRISQILSQPKPLVLLDGRPMYRRAADSFPRAHKTVFVTLSAIADHMVTTSAEAVVVLEETPSGQALTTELGLSKLDEAQDVIVTSCDHTVVLDPHRWQKFIAHPDCDAAIFTVKGFPGTVRTPASFSYVKADKDLIVEEIGVKKPFTEHPEEESLLVGSFWFKDAKILQEAIDSLKSRNVRVNGELYLDSVFNLMIERGMKVREIALEGYINWGDANSLKEALYWYEIFMGHKMQPRLPYPGYMGK